MSLIIVAHIHAVDGHAEALSNELVKLIAPTLAEAGCIQYDLHQDNENPNHFLFFESWESRELWQDHMQADHLAAFKSAAEGMLDKIEIFEMTRR